MKKAITNIIIAVISTAVISGCSLQGDNDIAVISAPTAQVLLPTPAPTSPEDLHSLLTIYKTPEKYTYDNLMTDIAILQKAYGTLVQPIKLCETADGRDVCDIVVGDQQSDKQILIFGAIHAREYITSQIVMRQLCDYLSFVSGNEYGEYNGISKKTLSEGITIHFIPMSNPDGVTISQFGLEGIKNESVRNSLAKMGSGNYEQWKANAEGVDLNRNFDAGWNEFSGSAGPSSDRYKGTAPGSAAEAAALIELTENYNFSETISYHTCGAQIYWYYLQSDSVLEQSRVFAECISKETGYVLDGNYQSVDAAGYKDWAVLKMGIPSITIETGNENGGGITNPVPINRFDSIWSRNKNVVYAALYNLKY